MDDAPPHLDKQEYEHPKLARASYLGGTFDGLLSTDPPRFERALQNAEELVVVLRELAGGRVNLDDEGPGLRAGLLDLVEERGEVALAELARLVGRPLGTVSYHVRAMHDAGNIVLDGQSVRVVGR